MTKRLGLFLSFLLFTFFILPIAYSESNSVNSSGVFDYTVLEGLRSYKYDEFDKEWSIQAINTTTTPPVVGVIAIGNKEEVTEIMLSVISDYDGGKIKGVDFLVDDVAYSYQDIKGDKLKGGTLAVHYLGRQGVNLITAMADANRIRIRIRYDDTSNTVIDSEKDDLEDFMRTISTFVSSNALDHISRDFLADADKLEKLYPLTITE